MQKTGITNNGCDAVIPCLKVFVDALNEASDHHRMGRIFLEIAAKCTSQSNGAVKFYRTHPISVALMEAFDPEWIKTQKKEAIDGLHLLYAATETYEFESQLPPQESTFEKAKIFSDITDHPHIKSVCVISTDENIEAVRKRINDADDSFDYSSIVVKSPWDWVIEQITNKTPISSIVASVLIKETGVLEALAEKSKPKAPDA